MTPEQFYDAEVFEAGQQFFNRAVGENPRAKSDRTSVLPGRYFHTALAAAAIGLISLNTPTVSGSSLQLEVRNPAHGAEAAVKVPRLTAQQARSARIIRNAFEAVPIGEDAEGEDPDYGF